MIECRVSERVSVVVGVKNDTIGGGWNVEAV